MGWSDQNWMCGEVQNPILRLRFLKLPGTMEVAPYVYVVILCGTWVSPPIRMRIDTGADMSVVPARFLQHAQPKSNVQIRGYAGTVQWEYTHDVCLALLDSSGQEIWQEHPSRGVLGSRNRSCGLLGMDVLRHFRLVLENEFVSLERIGD